MNSTALFSRRGAISFFNSPLPAVEEYGLGSATLNHENAHSCIAHHRRFPLADNRFAASSSTARYFGGTSSMFARRCTAS